MALTTSRLNSSPPPTYTSSRTPNDISRYTRTRGYLTRRGIKVRIARRDIESSERLGRHRWKAERTIAWLFGCRRLRVRYDRGSERFYAFGLLACCRLSFNRYTDHTTLQPDRPLLAW